MCGILLALSRNNAIDRTRFNIARDSLTHRGPDAFGSVFLEESRVAIGHRRLSILDLSRAANQPMNLGPLWVTYNGEIYNFLDLRKQLEKKGCVFRTQTDTEVLLHGYRVWGEALCEHLTGMFAFAIWDDEKKVTYLARDHIGQKPLYYILTSNTFEAASEIKALKILSESSLKSRRESIIDLLVYDYIPEPYTWYAGIECLLPGHYMTINFKNDGLEKKQFQYWNFIPDPDPMPISEHRALEILEEAIQKTVKAHMLSDVEVGAFLSGGIDSAGIVSLALPHTQNHQIKTFSIGFGSEDGDELPLARKTAEYLNTDHYEKVVDEKMFDAGIQNVLEVFDQPFADTSLVPTEQVASLASQHVKVVLTGDGGDEIFGGYRFYFKYLSFPEFQSGSIDNFIISLGIRLRGLKKWQSTVNFGHTQLSNLIIKEIFAPEYLKTIKGYDPFWYFKKYWRPEIDPVRRGQWLDIKTYLPSDILVKVDRTAMQHSLEPRPPFLSHHLAETMLNMPTSIRNFAGGNKYLLRQCLSSRVPHSIAFGEKRGFAFPVWGKKTSLNKGISAKKLNALKKYNLFDDAYLSQTTHPNMVFKISQLASALENPPKI